ncbi:hypothetical protein JVT61DRAFT_3516 [Boletus reticuloceps]|uniref:Uncharacterized protein n=1 Tax=Boletus reticuloceps TaxID=495285 RepID=A0A8I3AA24_9AGAM|nr:hypothetical protein JVT61DRAFT_3516 [Boletus reticuloceps]
MTQTDELAQQDNTSSHCYKSRHSSRSSSFNESTAEILLGLFRKDTRIEANLGAQYEDEEDPAVRDMVIRAHGEDPDSWVSKKLARVVPTEPVHIRHRDNLSSHNQGMKRPRSPTDSETEGESKRLKAQEARNSIDQ